MEERKKRLTRNQRIIRDFKSGESIAWLTLEYFGKTGSWMVNDKVESIIRRALRKQGKRR